MYPVQCTPGWARCLATLPVDAALQRVGLADPSGVPVPTQCTPIVWHKNGSPFMLLLIARITAAGAYPIVADPPPLTAPAFVPAWPAASVTFNEGGVMYRAPLTLAAIAASTDTWHDGPLAMERAVVVVPKTDSGQLHPLILVTFDVRAFMDGSSYVDTSITNARNSIDARVVVLSNLTIIVGSTTIWARDQTIWQGQCPSWPGATGAYLGSRVHPDSQMYYDAGLIEPILPLVENPTGVDSSGAAWEPGNFGTMSYSMSAPGGRAELGPYTNITASYLVHHGNDQQDRVLVDGRLAGSWCAMINNADGVTPIELTDDPHFQYASVRGEKQYYQLNGPHLPSLAFVPYLLTGDRVYLRLLQAWAHTAVLDVWDGAANASANGSDVDYDYSRHVGGDICFLGASYFAEPRGIGWVLRGLTDAAVCTPTREVRTKTYLSTIVSQNIARFDAYAARPGGGFYNVPGWEIDPGGGDGQYGGVHEHFGSIAFWQWAYAWFAFRHATS